MINFNLIWYKNINKLSQTQMKLFRLIKTSLINLMSTQSKLTGGLIELNFRLKYYRVIYRKLWLIHLLLIDFTLENVKILI